MMTLIWFIVIFGVVVIAHEFGHFLLAKANGIHVVEFAVGMGPTLCSFQKKGTKYSLKIFPIGGACLFEGEDGLMTGEGEESPGSFLKANVWSRISTVLAGPVFNFILAFLIAFIMVNMTGIIAIRDPIASHVAEGSGAQAAGLQDGDRILSINGEKVKLFTEIPLYMQTSYTGGELEVVYERGGNEYTAVVTPQYDEASGSYLLGIYNDAFLQPKGVETFRYAWYEMRYSVKATYKSLGMIFRGRVSRQDIAGPVGIAVNVVGKTYDEAREYGWQSVLLSMLNITLMLSVNLGILNLLPVPALDGGRLVFLLLEVIRGKPVPPEKEGMVHFVGLMFFMVLMVVIFFNDLSNIFMK